MIQTLPAVILGLFTRWFNSWALLVGWAAGTLLGTWMFFSVNPPAPTYPLNIAGFGMPGYAAFYTLILNLALAAVLTFVLNAMGSRARDDATRPADYYV